MRKIALLTIGLISQPSIANLMDDVNYAIYPTLSIVSVDDPEGASKVTADNFGVSAAAFYQFGREQRISVELAKVDAEFSASQTEVGQKAEALDLTVTYQRQFKLTKAFEPWLGIGLIYSKADFSSRFLIDDEGFLATEFDDRSESLVGLSVNAYETHRLSKQYALLFTASYQYIGDGLNGFKLGLGIQF